MMDKNMVTVTLDSGQVITFDARMMTVDDGLAFYISQLAALESKVYEVKYRGIVYQEFVPVDTSMPEYLDQIDYISYDAVTSGKFIGANARDVPQSDINANKSVIPVFYGGNSYGYSLDELRKSQQMRIPLDTTKGRASRRGFEEHAQRVAFQGDADRGVYGLFNNPNVQLSNSLLDFSVATGQQIVSYMNALLISVWQNSAETHLANVFVLDSANWAIISEKRMDSGTDTTVLEFFKKNNLYTAKTDQPLTVRQNFELKTAGTGGVPRMMAYELNPDNLVMHMPMPWRTIAPQAKGLRIETFAEYKFGGVEFRYPGSAAYHDNVA
jgi:hypothetical protein